MINSLSDAEQCLRRAIDLAPGDAANYANLALLLDKPGCREEAEQCYRCAVAMDATCSESRVKLADFLANSHSDEDVAEAKAIYLDVIKIMPTHFSAWNNLGNLLFKTGYTSAAHTAYSAAIAYHPGEASTHAHLGQVLLYRNELTAAEKHFLNALDLDPEQAEAHQGLACIFHRQNNGGKADYHRDKGYSRKPITTLPWHGRHEPLPLLILASAIEGNIPWRFLVDQSLFQTTIITVEYFDAPIDFASYPLIFNAIGDADLCRNGLERASRLVAKTQSSVINAPDAVLQTGRLANTQRLAQLPGVTAPRMASVSKADVCSGQALQQLARNGVTFPLLIRTPGFHGGNYFVRVNSLSGFEGAVKNLPGEHLLAIEFLDSRAEDTLFRKYRVMAINGVLYPVHMAISTGWKVHYFSSDMAENLHYRQEEEAFLHDFVSVLGVSAISALERISQTLGLDYCGIDFGMDKNGCIMLYEANATMVINPPEHEKQWDYKRLSIEHALTATKNMLSERVALAKASRPEHILSRIDSEQI
ncbi:MAG: ATP-grasp domain-containing protein [Sulfuriferula sp.]